MQSQSSAPSGPIATNVENVLNTFAADASAAAAALAVPVTGVLEPVLALEQPSGDGGGGLVALYIFLAISGLAIVAVVVIKLGQKTRSGPSDRFKGLNNEHFVKSTPSNGQEMSIMVSKEQAGRI
jgi:hypothetical protein